MKVKNIIFEGELEVFGIYNFNGTESKQGNNNHTGAKHDLSGRDYTSGNCLRYELFKDIQPRQPSYKEKAEHFLNLASSEVGILRGYLSPKEGLKRSSPINVVDAYTTDEFMTVFTYKDGNTRKGVLFDEKLVNSKPKEGELINAAGEEESDISFYSKDNAPTRRQKFRSVLSIRELQFLSLDSGYCRMVSPEMEPEFVLGIEKTFKNLGHKFKPEIKKYREIYINSANVEQKVATPVIRNGILLSDEEIKVLTISYLNRILSLSGYKARASLEIVPATIKMIFKDNFSTKTYNNYSEFKNILQETTFASFYTDSLE